MDTKLNINNKEETLELLKQNGIEFHLQEHEPIPTVQDWFDKVKQDKFKPEQFTFIKNLFLKNKTGGFFLLAANSASQVDFKILQKILKIKSGNLRQAEKEQLQSHLGVEPGSVNPLCLLNASGDKKKEIVFLFDKTITTEYVSIHPMNNSATIWLKTKDLISLLEKNGWTITSIDLAKGPEDEPVEEKKVEAKPKGGKQDKKGHESTKTADEEKNLLGITVKKEDNFSDWYSEVIVKSEMIEYYDISGCYILRPWAYAIWESIQKFFDDKIKDIGVQNAYFPLFVSAKALNKEKDHVEGFQPEVAWVTKSGDKDLEFPIAIRPTSETIMYPSFSKWIRSHRDLPLKLNQWTNVVRWEFKNPTPFIRTREFLWQEGHTAHSTLQEADKQVYEILDLYRQTYEDLLAVPVIPGKKSENEKFAGGFYTTTVETMVSNGKGIQCATSHNLGQNFSKMFDIKYLDENQKDSYAWQTSWGMTTRTIGVMIMVHSDDHGLVLPPRVAPIQVILVPIITIKDDPATINNQLYEISKQLKALGIRTKVDDRDLYNPGWKFSHWELKGVPLRIEFGAKDMKNGQVTLVCRDNKDRSFVKYSEAAETVQKLLDVIQRRMFEKAKNGLDSRKKIAKNFESFYSSLSDKNMVLTPWCNRKECEEDVKKKVKVESEKSGVDEGNAGSCKTLCLPTEQPALDPEEKCFFCGQKAEITALWGRSY